ncbi:sodium:alanine symporter [Pseudomonas abyssi]|uniref:Sodium:alanine symporter n=1 Tax=Pseudomonas abyssi TaxID=170540 RepID=A0A2A3MKA6_9PSED|nr:alanine/glycine:cation symporter family protein [Pseudomonas abyssi]MAC98481.1 alanine:cation symporter family protein [Pseudomonadales bacterium]PBK05223.1 sodium:alanine symporter [Pseudomonas abyssi]|tara:strand:- start:11662 stop:13092 length:1431 start_codon:yes stop_codon:yes gene_type:complete
MLSALSDLLWSKILIAMLVGIGVWFTIATRFVQFRYFGKMFGILTAKHHEADGRHLSSFQALILSVAGRVGGGNIAGVAVAITLGGPGAIFWMWVVGLMGMATSFIECTLAQLYKTAEPDGAYRGGPAHYIERGLGRNWKWLAVVYSVLLLVTFGIGFIALQSYAVATSLQDAFSIPLYYSGIGLALVVGLIIFGGVKRIAQVAEVLVPIMAGGYLLIAVVVLGLNFSEIPATLKLIVESAFGIGPVVGGGIGAAILMGVKRGLFSNEAGLGSAPNVASVAFVPHPANQGVVQSFSVFIDTIVLCTCTALIILMGTAYDPTLGDASQGVALTQASLATHIGEWGRVFVSIAMLLFGFSTVLYNYYLGENSVSYLTTGRSNEFVMNGFRVVVICLCCLGAIMDLGTVFGFADLTMGLLALVNLVALTLLFKTGKRVLADYDRQLKSGNKTPTFHAEEYADLDLDHESWPASQRKDNH